MSEHEQGTSPQETPEQETPEHETPEHETSTPELADAVIEDSVHLSAEPIEEFHVDRYESAWMRLSAVILAIFFVTVLISGFSAGFQVPGVYERVDPTTLYDEGSPWAQPELRELAPGKYEVHIRAQVWQFTPNEIHVPAGSTVTFYVTSQDVQHGIKLTKTNINMMVLPGQVGKLTAKFDNPGEYHFICHEYCGQLHHTMYGRLIVEAPTDETEQTQTAAALTVQ